MEDFVKKRVKKSVSLMDKAGQLSDPCCALHILRTCLGYCKITYALRTIPPDGQQEALREYGRLQRDTLQNIVKGQPLGPMEWGIAQLGIKNGGLGLRDPIPHELYD